MLSLLAVVTVVWVLSCVLALGVCAAAHQGDLAIGHAAAKPPPPTPNPGDASVEGRVARRLTPVGSD